MRKVQLLPYWLFALNSKELSAVQTPGVRQTVARGVEELMLLTELIEPESGSRMMLLAEPETPWQHST